MTAPKAYRVHDVLSLLAALGELPGSITGSFGSGHYRQQPVCHKCSVARTYSVNFLKAGVLLYPTVSDFMRSAPLDSVAEYSCYLCTNLIKVKPDGDSGTR